MKSEQQKLDEHLDFLQDILSDRVISSLKLQVGRAMSECIQQEREKCIDSRLLTLEPMLKYYEQRADHNPLGKFALNDVVKKIKELYKQTL